MANNAANVVPIRREAPLRLRSEVKKARLRAAQRGRVVENLPLWAQATRIGGGLDPRLISSIIREADSGEVCRLVDLANECRQRDAHLQAVLGVGEESIAGRSWQIVPYTPPGAKKPREKDKRLAAWVDEVLRGNPGLHRLIADLAGAIYYGHSVSEVTWVKKGQNLVPDEFHPIAPRRFRFRREDGKFVQYDSSGQELDLADHPYKFVVSRPRVTGDVPNREGLMRVLVWMSAMRNWSLGDWLKTGELSWKPWRIGTYKKATATSVDIEDLENVMRRMTTDFSATIPDSTEIRIEWPGGSTTRGSTHAEIVRALGDEESKAVLGQTETTQSSSSSGYAQSKTHNEVRKDLRESRARQVAADITRDLVTAIVVLNKGPNAGIPRFEFITQDPVDLESFSKSLVNLKTAGARMPEEWVHEEAGIPLPKDGETLLGGAIAGEEPEEDAAAATDDTKQPPAESDSEEPDGEEPEPELWRHVGFVSRPPKPVPAEEE